MALAMGPRKRRGRPKISLGFSRTTEGRTGSSWFLRRLQEFGAGDASCWTNDLSAASHSKVIGPGPLGNVHPSPTLPGIQQKGETKRKKKEAKIGFSICFCFPSCSFQGWGSAKPLKATASSVHFPLCNLPALPAPDSHQSPHNVSTSRLRGQNFQVKCNPLT